MRDKSISVSEGEQQMLNDAAIELTGTSDMPYGATITMLVREATDVEVN